MSKQQLTGMRGVFLVASELTRLGLIVSPTSRSAMGADILATDQKCKKAYSIQVKTNARTFNFWLLSKSTQEEVSPSHVYVFVNIKKNKIGEIIEYYIVPSKVVAERMVISESKNSVWFSIQAADIKKYKDKWTVLKGVKLS